MPWTELDLSTAYFVDGHGEYSGGTMHANDIYSWQAIFSDVVFDPATAYDVQIEFTDDGTTPGPDPFEIALFSLITPDQTGFDTSDQWMLIDVVGPTSPLTITVGPGVGQWDDAVAAGEAYVAFYFYKSTSVSAMRWRIFGDEPTGSDTSNQLYGRRRGGLAAASVGAPVVAPPPTLVLAPKYDLAIAYPTPDMVNGRPT